MLQIEGFDIAFKRSMLWISAIELFNFAYLLINNLKSKLTPKICVSFIMFSGCYLYLDNVIY